MVTGLCDYAECGCGHDIDVGVVQVVTGLCDYAEVGVVQNVGVVHVVTVTQRWVGQVVTGLCDYAEVGVVQMVTGLCDWRAKRALSREVDGELCITLHARIWLSVEVYIHMYVCIYLRSLPGEYTEDLRTRLKGD